MAIKHLLLVFAIGLTVAAAQNEANLDFIPPDLKGEVTDEKVHELQEKSTKAFREKCEKNGGAGTYNSVEEAFKGFTTCIQGLVNKDVLEQEIEAAKPTGQVDEIFKKYCAKIPQFKSCFLNMTEAARPCFAADEGKHITTVRNVTGQLADFVCIKDGDQIALFIAEHGPECIKEKQEEMQACVNSTLGDSSQLDTDSFDALLAIKFGEKECAQLARLQACVVRALEACAQPTTANIVESLFKYARKASPCKSFPENPQDNARNRNTAADTERKANSAPALAVAAATILTAVFAHLI